jgi:hypothetical protein
VEGFNSGLKGLIGEPREWIYIAVELFYNFATLICKKT